LTPAKLYDAQQLQPPAPPDIEAEAAAFAAASNPDCGPQMPFVSSSKLDAVLRILQQYHA